MFKRYTLLLACIFFNMNLYPAPADNCSSIYKDYFSHYVRQEGNKILINKKVDLGDLSFALRQNYEDCLTRAIDRLCGGCCTQPNLFVEVSTIQNVVAEELKCFVEFVETLIFVVQLDSKINDAVCDLLHKNGLVKDDAFKNASTEYNSRYNKVKDKLQSVMLAEHKNYVTRMEVEDAVRCEFMALVARIKKAKSDESEKNKPNGSAFWNWLVGAGSNLSRSEGGGAASDKVYKNEVEQRVVVIVDYVLQEKGYHQNLLPAKVISDYSDAVQKIIEDAKDKIFYNNYEYLYVDEIKAIARLELQPIFDKI